MGRLFLRACLRPELARDAARAIEIVHVNELNGTIETGAHLLEFDSVHGRLRLSVSHDADHLEVDGRRISWSAHGDPGQPPWSQLDVDIVVECTGRFISAAQLAPYFEAGVKKVIVAAPVGDADLNIVMGVNDGLYDSDRHHLVTAASCTTNCLAPVIKVIHENIGIRHGAITTIHDVTNTQVVVDAPHKDLRRARSALTSLIPTSTGSATAIAMIYPELEGKLNGLAVRVPLLNASLTDCVFEVKRPVDADEVNRLFEQASENGLKGILGFETRPLVSVDYTNDPRSAIIDGPSTMVIDGTQVKILAWYDNEIGYVCRMAELAALVAQKMTVPGAAKRPS